MKPITNKTILRKLLTLFPFVAGVLLPMQGADARFSHPANVATDASGAIYIADADNNYIPKFK